MGPKCDSCGRPATWHLGWKSPAMPAAPPIEHACDQHRLVGMVPIESPIEAPPDCLSDEGDDPNAL
jgi:hypothetical protein